MPKCKYIRKMVKIEKKKCNSFAMKGKKYCYHHNMNNNYLTYLAANLIIPLFYLILVLPKSNYLFPQIMTLLIFNVVPSLLIFSSFSKELNIKEDVEYSKIMFITISPVLIWAFGYLGLLMGWALMFVGIALIILTLRSYHTKQKITSLELTLLILAIFSLDASSPIFVPRVEIVEISDPLIGIITTNKDVVSKSSTISIKPPILSFTFPCSTINLGHNVTNIILKDVTSEYRVLLSKDGKTQICVNNIYLSSNTFLPMRIESWYPLNYNKHTNISYFYKSNRFGKTNYTSNIYFSNNNFFEIQIRGGVYFYITNETIVNNEPFLPILTNNNDTLNCYLRNMFIQESYNSSRMVNAEPMITTDGSIRLSLSSFKNIKPFKSYNPRILVLNNSC